jgi:hypothetical protein
LTADVANVNELALRRILVENKHSIDDARFVVVGKHLCGDCSDVAVSLACGGDSHRHSDDDVDSERRLTFSSIAIATCCHHLITKNRGDMFANFTDDEFATLVLMSSWATIDVNKTNTNNNDTNADDNENDYNDSERDVKVDSTTNSFYASSVDVTVPFSSATKLQIGRRIKVLIDLARAHRLRQSNRFSTVKLIRFTNLSVESTLLLALK